MTKNNHRTKLSDLITSLGGLIIIVLAMGAMFLTNISLRGGTLNDWSGIIGASIGLLFTVITFAFYYHTVNKQEHHSTKPRN